MALSSESSNTNPSNVTLNAPSTLASPTSAKTRVLLVDLINLINGDTLEIRISSRLGSADATPRVAYEATYGNAQSEPLIYSPPVPQMYGGTFVIEQTGGTPRSFPWEILTLD